ncbi:uncharacterized protein K452DRAFT_315686 [Aplosporella prunicola CBS 121167]|uniref:Major facilitator superfamily (MFS) profile domain-containing protein n=1 Tax=Aplosporella prunicola CBS 121167 TaxID=1176127 RepID=A0A6A6BMS8_9PEZI|nr:uncharacterized protein K452DRAFT_315686 [Aplosporella prunicola CBS 121167]KAF2145439.1 hypothetical protein K452DRAFT_315686 [Aplosporella prunicola CBS 121167]
MEKDTASGQDIESGNGPRVLPHWKIVTDKACVTPEVLNWPYAGEGTEASPYVVKWIDNDPRNPTLWSGSYKWAVTLTMAFSTLAVSFCSSAFEGGIAGMMMQYGMSQEVAILGLSFFVLGFALGPLLWAPFSELYGRQVLFIGTFAMFSFFNAGVAGSQNTQSILICRFFAGSFGSSPMTNAGGVIADMFNAKQRGLAMSIFCLCPFMGPVLGPIVGGFVGETVGWRWIMAIMAIFSGVLWIFGTFMIPETYAPVLLKARAAKLSQMTGKVYKSKMEVDQGTVTVGEAFKTSLSRPWILLFMEPIVLLLSIYMAIVYGTLYMLFGAFPIVYEQSRGWSAGISSLAFLGVAIGMVASVLYIIFFDNKRYAKVSEENGGFAPAETRLHPAIIGGISLPIGLIWFAWTNYPTMPWAASIAGGIPFGFGMVLVFLSIMNYLIDAYTIFAASVLAANSVLRSIFGAVFPLFTTYMYMDLGIHWASMIPAFLALACLPAPFLFYRYGAAIRQKCKYAAQSEAFMRSLAEEQATQPNSETTKADEDALNHIGEDEQVDEARYVESKTASTSVRGTTSEKVQEEEEEIAEDTGEDSDVEGGRFARIKTAASARRTSVTYEESPFDIDRVHTRESFNSSAKSHRTGRRSLAKTISKISRK